MSKIPDPNAVFPNEYKTSCFIKNVVTAPNITVGDYTYYDDAVDPTGFEKNNVLFNYPEFGDRLVIGKFCAIASGTKFIMGPAMCCIIMNLSVINSLSASSARLLPEPNLLWDQRITAFAV